MTSVSFLLAAGLAGLPRVPVDVDLLTCQAAREQQRIEYRWRMYEYLKEDVVEKYDEAALLERQSTVRRMHRSRPDGFSSGEIIEHDGAPLPAEEAAREKLKAQTKLAELKDVRARQSAIASGLKDSAEKASTMAAMDQAFELRFEGLDWLDGEPCFVVSFTPRSGFHPATREQAVFQKMQGVVFVRVERPVFLRVEADFVENASIKFGPFATITRGSHFLLQQADVEPGVPMARSLDLDLRLRLFFLVRQAQRRGTYYREFKRVNPAWPAFEP